MTGTTLDYYKRVYRTRRLEDAWRHVLESGAQSSSLATRDEVEEWSRRSRRGLRRLQSELRDGSFAFFPQKGVAPKKRSGRGHRPIVLAPIESRIVQRAILDVLLSQAQLRRLAQVRTSFGGIRNRGVPDAIQALVRAVQRGARFYVRSDIKDFFRRVPRQQVIDIIGELMPDDRFLQLLQSATKTELENLDALGALGGLFPTYEIGVAQGCSLSPLFGNLVLSEFDQKLNGRGIVCLRYIDDFLILGTKRSHVLRAFDGAQRILGAVGLEAYDPREEAGKAEMGEIAGGLTFLGCELRPGLIRPNRVSRSRLRNAIRERLNESLSTMDNSASCYNRGQSAARTLLDIRNIVHGWGNQYSFCNDRQMMQDLDNVISKAVADYIKALRAAVAGAVRTGDAQTWRRLVGVQLLVDCKYSPLEPYIL
jgi:RNA-directed DNA polymerase